MILVQNDTFSKKEYTFALFYPYTTKKFNKQMPLQSFKDSEYDLWWINFDNTDSKWSNTFDGKYLTVKCEEKINFPTRKHIAFMKKDDIYIFMGIVQAIEQVDDYTLKYEVVSTTFDLSILPKVR